MPKLPYKFLVFVAMGGFFYLYGLPKRAKFASHILSKARNENRLEKLKELAEERIRGEICTVNDLCEYRPIGWKDFYFEDSVSASVTHEFYMNGERRSYLFRMRYGTISEVQDMR